MNARCTGCDAHLEFHATRGAKLKELRCTCGARYEPIYTVRLEDLGKPYAHWRYRNFNNREFKLNQQTWKYEPLAPTATP